MIKRPNLIIIGLVCIFVVVEILFLRPSNLESVEESSTSMFNSIGSMVQAQKLKDDVGYTIDGFHYVAVEGELKHWEMVASEAVLYEKSRLVQAQHARIKMYDAAGQITNIEGDEAYYRMADRDLDLVGNVKVTFPDGFWIKTTKAHYSAKTGAIESTEPFNGEAIPQKGEIMQIWGKGFQASKFGPDIHIVSQARVKLRRLAQEEVTDVQSDRAKIDRFAKMALFFDV
jgi:LPS export ABC transporter protein LptC